MPGTSTGPENQTDADAVGEQALRLVGRRLLPLLFALYVANFIDRVDISIAALRMNHDLALSATGYGLASGVFFAGYLLFQVPAAIVIQRCGTRRALAAMAIGWGCASAATALATDLTTLMAARFALGVIEAGFFPGVIYYLGCWFPERWRARATAWFLLAVPVANVIGAPVAGLLVTRPLLFGAAGWRAMFVILAVPSIALGVTAWRMLPDGPRQARWLSEPRAVWLCTRIAAEHPPMDAPPRRPVLTALRSRRLLAYAGIYAGLYFAMYAFQFFLPQLVAGTGIASPAAVSGIVASFHALGAAAILAWSRHSDRTGERVKHLAAPALLAAVSLAVAAASGSPVLSLFAIAVTVATVLAAVPAFWSLPRALPPGLCASAGVAAINSLASIASFAAPYATGALRDCTGGYGAALLGTAVLLGASGIAALALGARTGQLRTVTVFDAG